ncbi:MAG: TonB-dependent receptor [Bacteroidales bacterium]|nr:TonB-dependent receptor [Bacteroidales bacterium]
MITINVSAQEKNDSIDVNSKKTNEEGNRNVMLNASNANGPREISIGLPGGDVNVLENGLPVVFATNPHSVETHWRSDGSLSHVGLLKITETAITTGNIGYAVNSFSELGSEGFKGKVNYSTNHFGKQQFDININGNIGKDWFYSGSIYQNFDPGSTKMVFTPFQDKTSIYKAAITKKYNNNKGSLSVIYHYSNSNALSTASTAAPFIYVGDGSVEQIPGFSLGTSSYLPSNGELVYMDIKTGEIKKTTLNDASKNRGNEISLINTYKWNNGLEWKTMFKYDDALGSRIYQTPMSLEMKSVSDGYKLVNNDGSLSDYKGYVQSRMSCFNRGDIKDILLTSELSQKNSNNTWRIGINQWHYIVDYSSNTSMYDQTVEASPSRLTKDGTTFYYDFNKNASEYYKGNENKLAIYGNHEWNVTDKFDVYYGARVEYQRLKGENAAVYANDGTAVGRFPNYHLGATYNVNGMTGVIAAQPFEYNWINGAFTAALTYKFNNNFGLTGDFTYNSQHVKMESFSPAELPNTGRVIIPLAQGGFYYNNDWVSLTSLVSYISKSNNNSTLNLINPDDASEIKAAPLCYDIQTLGWTTDAVVKPFKNFDVHMRFTYQNPTYKKYETSVTFVNGKTQTIDVTGNTVTEIPKVLIEIDPSYYITEKLKLWASFRYFSKTYANIENAYFFNGRWETFGGLNWKVNKNLSLGTTVINFLNQTGASGSIAGAELTKKEDASLHNGKWMAGSYIRPFTVEFSANITF